MSFERALELMPSGDTLLQRYRNLCRYVGLSDDDIQRATSAWRLIEPHVPDHVSDFYAEVLKHEETMAVITGGDAQVERLKTTLTTWIEELFRGVFDEAFVERRWIVGWRHVQIGLSQVWASAAMCRLRDQMLRQLADDWPDSVASFELTASAITRLMDLDMALIQDAYHAESVATRLREERDFAEAIIGTTETIVLVIDESGNLLRGNNYVARVVSDRDELPDTITSVHSLLSKDEADSISTLIEAADGDQSVGPTVTSLVDAKGRERKIRWFCKRIRQSFDDSIHELSHAKLLVGHDVTDLSEAQRQIVQQERLAAIGQTMAGLAHESRNAFQRSQASLETLALEVSDKPDAVKLIERIQRAHDHLLHLYEEVLQFAKPVLLNLERCNVKDVVTRTWAHITEANDIARDRLTVHEQGDVGRILCDSFALEQILRNLIENAITVSPDEQLVEVGIRRDWQGDRPAVQITIADCGPGIPPEYREKIFEPFFSTRSRGTGLGLPIARRLAEAHGGSLTLDSTDHGTTAILVLPEQSSGDLTVDPENHPDYRRS